MLSIKYKDLLDLNDKAYKWCEKINNKTHSTTNEVPKVRLLEEKLNKMTREYLVENNNVRKVEKDCLISYKSNRYSVQPKYIYRHVIVAVLGTILRIYCDGTNIETHPLSNGTRQMIISKAHYDLLSHYGDKADRNSIYMDNSYDDQINISDLGVYDYE